MKKERKGANPLILIYERRKEEKKRGRRDFYIPSIFIDMENVIIDELKNLHKDIEEIKKKLEEIEEIILPSEEITEEELEEIRKLKEESLKGGHVEWDKIKEEIL